MALPNYWEEDVLHCNVLQTSIKKKNTVFFFFLSLFLIKFEFIIFL